MTDSAATCVRCSATGLFEPCCSSHDAVMCSALWPTPAEPIYAFGKHGPIAEQRGFVPRDRIGEYARLRLADDPFAFDLLEPFDD